MKKILIVLILGLYIKVVCAQQTTYINHGFTYPPPYDYIPSIIGNLSPKNSAYNDSCTILGGFFWSFNSSSLFLKKFNLKENKFLNDSNFTLIDSSGFKVKVLRYANKALKIGNLKYIGLGLVNKFNGKKSTVLYKYDSNLNIKYVGNVLPVNNDIVGAFSFKNFNNHIVVIGQDYGFPGSGPSFMGRTFVSELDTLGNILSVIYSTNQVGSNFIICDYAQTDNGLIVLGHRQTLKYHNVISDYSRPGVAVLFRNNGTQKILKIGNENVDMDLPLLSLTKINETDFLVRTQRMDTLEVGAPIKDAILCMDTALNVKWIKNLDSTAQMGKRIGDIIKVQDNNFVINGSEINMEISEQYQDAFRQPFLRKIDSSGKYIWKRSIVYNEKFLHQTLGEIIEMPNEDLVMYGVLMDIHGLVETPLQKMWIVRTDKYGCLVPGCEMWDNIEEKEADNALISFYPNPAQHEINIFNPAHNKAYTGSIIDLSGKTIVPRITLSPQATTIVPLTSLKSGMFILVLNDKDGNTQTHKLIKQ